MGLRALIAELLLPARAPLMEAKRSPIATNGAHRPPRLGRAVSSA